MYLGTESIANFNGDVNVWAGAYGIGIDGGSSTFNQNLNIDVQGGNGSDKRGISSKGQSLFNGRVNINVHANGGYGIYARSDSSAYMTFNDFLSITMTADSDSSRTNYGIMVFNNKVTLNNGGKIDLSGDSYLYGRTGVYASQGQVDIKNNFSIYTNGEDTDYALLATNGGKINIEQSVVDLTGHIGVNGAGTEISIESRSGSIIHGDTMMFASGIIDFNLAGTQWFFQNDSQLNILNATQSHFYFPTASAGNFRTLTVETLSGSNNTFWMNTVLNDGSVQDSDRLIVNQSGAGQHKLHISNVGGGGDITVGDGIQVVEVNGTSGSGNFSLANIVRGGIYEYTLHQGSTVTAGDQSWYLRSNARQLNPDIGSFLANQTAATGLFMHSLHDRLGEPQYAERYKQEGRQPSVWVRTAVSHSKNQAGGGIFKQENDGYLVHLGGDIAQWTTDENSRYHLGVMGAYGKNETKTRSTTTNSRVKGSIDGYGAGMYLTWYANESMPEGWYADIWSMYNWFDNETESLNQYKSKAWTSSAEMGYALKMAEQARWQWMLEPHAQLAYTYYSAGNHTDSYGMRMSDDDASGVTSRVGGRVYLRDGNNQMNAQPFLEGNWLHSTAKNSLRFNGEKVSDDTPGNRFEAKVGVQGEIAPNVQIYSHVGLQWGKDQYGRTEGQLGLKYRF